MTSHRWLALVLLLTSCHSHDHDDHEKKGDAHDHGATKKQGERTLPSVAHTHWTERAELFIEYPALVVGKDSKTAAHITRLSDFSAPTQAVVTLVLARDSGEETFAQTNTETPGIFRPIFRPSQAGKAKLLVRVTGEGLDETHDLGEVTVFESEEKAMATPEEPEAAGHISFLKEQQWPIEFNTAVVGLRGIRPTLRATGELRARSDGDAVIAAPAAGRVGSSPKSTFPRLGDRVKAEAPLALLAPKLDAADLASLEFAVKSAELEQRYAERERERLETLRKEGVVPERRATDAAHAADGAKAELTAARRRLAQYAGVQQTRGGGEGSMLLRAPVGGFVTKVHVAPGSYVEASAPLFRVTDTTQLWLEAHVAEVDAHKLVTLHGASFTLDGQKEPIELGPETLVGRGHLIDPVTRTLEVFFAVDNAGGRFPVGVFVRARIAIGEQVDVVAVPESALVDDAGLDVVFEQVEGEAFERRIVVLGSRDRGFVEIKSGLSVGARVVTRGAWSLKLASASGAVPSHGHDH